MTKAVFYYQLGKIKKLEVNGHTGYQDSGSDIVCSAISTAVFTSINLIDKVYGNNSYTLNQNEKNGFICLQLNEETKLISQIMDNLWDMLKDIETDYKPYLSLKKENIL